MQNTILKLLMLSAFFIADNAISQTVNASYLSPQNITPGSYKFTRFGTPSEYYAGLMWNEGSASYGDGDDFTIFTYGNRDIMLRPGTGNLVVFPSSGGNMGIGTTSPEGKLSIELPSGTGEFPTVSTRGDVVQIIKSNNNSIAFGNAKGQNDRKAWILARHNSVSAYGKYYSSLHLQPDVGVKSQYRGVAVGYTSDTAIPVGTHLAVAGNVGIGTLNPDAELTVKGNIHAEEVRVDLSVPAPDYVFKSEYDLKSLEEVQTYIEEHGHLPNIPSAMELEENGVKLGILNMKLLEKIEELTLYTLQQEKKLEQQAEEITALKDLEQRLLALENQRE